MSIERAPRRARYTIVDNTVLEDPRLSFKAKGLLAYILSKPDHWRTNRDHLASVGKDGVAAVRSAMTELEKAGYVVRRRVRGTSGQWDWHTIVHEVPVTKDPETARTPLQIVREGP